MGIKSAVPTISS